MLGKRLIHDKWMLFLVLIVTLLVAFSLLSVLLRIDTSQQITIVRYKTSLGLSGFDRGPSSDLYSFAFMALIAGVSSILIARKVYYLRRSAALLSLSLAIIVLFFNIIVSGALLNLQ
jgi:hypothetical protein